MKNMTFENIAKACGGELILNGADATVEVEGGVIDSRLVKENYMFFATKGERVDGHDYIAKAFDLGAILAVCERIPEGVEGPFILVEDTFVALKQIAKFYREQLDIKVVGITGSVGKTSTKEFIASVLAQKYNVLKTEGNFNNEVGLPLTVLKIRDDHEVAVLEMGISDFGEMTRLSEIAQPDVCVITNIGQCHLEQLGDRDGVLKAKTEVFANLKEDGVACLFAEDDKLAGIAEVNGRKPVFYGMHDDAEVYATDVVNKGLLGSECVIHVGEMTIEAEIPLPGKHMVYNALAATAVGNALALSAEEIEKGIRAVEAVRGRSHIVKTSEYTLIDDCYNANPVSMKAAIDLLCEAITRKVAILGDMFELGENEKSLHRSVGAYAAERQVDVLICVGSLSEELYQGAADFENKKETMELYHYETLEDCKNEVAGLLRPSDAILVKASHGMHFTELVEFFTQENETTCQAGKEKGENMGTEEKKDTAAVEDAYSKAMEEVYESNQKTNKVEDKTHTLKYKKALIIAAVILGVLIVACIIVLIAKHNHYKSLTQGVMLYQDEGQMMRVKFLNDPVYSEQYNSWNFNEEGADNDKNPSAATTDGKYLYYAENNNGSSFDLYRATVSSGKSALIATGVTDYEILKKGVIYYAADNALYCYDVKAETISHICNDVKTFRLSDKKDTVLMLGGSDGKLSSLELDNAGSLTTIETGVKDVESASEDFKTIVYNKEEGLYFYSAKGNEKVLIAKSYTDLYIYNIDKKCEVYYLTSEGSLCYYKAGEDISELVSVDVWQLYGADSESAIFFAAVGSGGGACEYKLISGGDAIAMKDAFSMELGDDIYVDTSAKKVYFIGYEQGNNQAGTLYAMGYQLLDKGKVVAVENSVISIELVDGKEMYLCKDAGNNSADLYCDGVLVARNIIPHSLSMTADKKAFVFEYQIGDEKGDRILAVYDGDAVKEVGSCAGSDYYAVTAKEIYFLQYGDTGYNYMKYNGRKVKLILQEVEQIHYLYY